MPMDEGGRGAGEKRRWLIVALHDVSPATAEPCERLASLVEECVPQAALTLLVVPRYHGANEIDRAHAWRGWIDRRLARGDELALHGLAHIDDGPRPRTPYDWFARRIMTASEGEFAALPAAEARRRIERGLALFKRCGWNATGFVPPAWKISASARTVLAEFGFSYTSTLTTLYQLPDWIEWRAWSLTFSARTAARRWLSLRWTGGLLRAQQNAPLLRIALHPADAAHEETLSGWRYLLTTAARDRTPVTKGQFVKLAAASAAIPA
jgi:predicted deacetylase